MAWGLVLSFVASGQIQLFPCLPPPQLAPAYLLACHPCRVLLSQQTCDHHPLDDTCIEAAEWIADVLKNLREVK